jgi:DNA-binding NtrC family response regulator
LVGSGSRAERLAASALQSLAAAGVDAQRLAAVGAAGYTIVLFDTVTPPLLELVEGLARGGVDRILGVACRHDAVDGTDAWRLLAAGASDVFAYDRAARSSVRVAARFDQRQRVDALASSREVGDRLIGNSPRWRAAIREAIETTCFTDAPVLLTGETGTGKELVAPLVPSLDSRKKQTVRSDRRAEASCSHAREAGPVRPQRRRRLHAGPSDRSAAR